MTNLRTFYTLVITQTLSLIGSRISSFAIGIWVFQETGNATPLTLVAFFSILPMVLASGFAGVLADRRDRRIIIVLSDFGQAIATVLLLLSFVSGSFELWHLYILAGVQAIAGVFQGPAFMASVTMLVPDEHRDRANAIQQMSGPAAGIVAPAVASFIYAAGGVAGAIAVDLLTFVIAMIVIFRTHIPRPKQTKEGAASQGTMWQEMVGGIRYLWDRKPLFWMMIYISILNFLVSGVTVLLTPYVLSRTSNNEFILGVVVSLTNVGALIGGLAVGLVSTGKRPRIHTVGYALFAFGFTLAAFGLSQHPLALIGWGFLMLIPLPTINALSMSVLQAKIAPDIQGRVFAVVSQMSMLLMPLSYLLIGPLVDQVFEPAVGQTGWDTVSGLVGNSPGAGIGLLILGSGILVVLLTGAVYAVRDIRNIETVLPDHIPEEVETTPSQPQTDDTTVPPQGDEGIATAPA